jgi:ribonuclease P protein component
MASGLALGRLAREDDFRRVYREGSRRSTALLVIHTRPNALGRIRLGIVVGRRFGRAVVRNRLRRRLREAVRVHRSSIGDAVDIVIVPRDAAVLAPSAELRAAVSTALPGTGARSGAPGGERTE